MLNTEVIHRFTDGYLSDIPALSRLSQEQSHSASDTSGNLNNIRTHPSISPFYQPLEKYRGILPPALFTCGTSDPLLDDSIMMATKWAVSGAKSVLKIYPGAPHSFLNVDAAEGKAAAESDCVEFLEDCLAGLE